jgi:hypothetical protein
MSLANIAKKKQRKCFLGGFAILARDELFSFLLTIYAKIRRRISRRQNETN